MTKLAESCGFDPLTRVGKLAVAVPEEGESGEIGIAANVTVSRDEIEKCTRGVSGGAEPKRIGSFGVVEDTRSSSHARIAYGKDGLLIAGRGSWFDTMLASAEGTRPTLADAAEHAAIRTSLTSRDGWHAPTILASALLPAELRERLRREMRAEIGPSGPRSGQTQDQASDVSAATMGGVLGVSGVGLAVRTGARIDAAIELVCDTADACGAVDKLIQKKRFDLSRELSLRLVGLGPLIDTITTTQENGGKRIRVTAGADAKQLADSVERILRLKSRKEAKHEPEPEPRPALVPDETLRGRDAGHL
jgi:hypothetical protein